MGSLLECRNVDVLINRRALVTGLGLTLNAGDFVAMLGPNGVGKTLSLHTLAGLRMPAAGEIYLRGDALVDLRRTEIARRLGLLLQDVDDAFPATSLEVAMLGNYARQDFWSHDDNHSRVRARAALADLDLNEIENQLSATLSGGERRRLALATLLVQNPAVLLLDEPMNHLDPLHRLTVLRHLSKLVSTGKAVLASMHDPALAAQYADAVLMLFGNGDWEYGPPARLLTAENLERLYGTPFVPYSRNGQEVLLPMA